MNRIRQFLISAPLGLVAFMAEASLHGQGIQQETVELETYTVTAHRMEVPLGKVGVALTVIEREDIEGFQSDFALEAVRHSAGLYLRNNGGPGGVPGVSVRGLPVAPMVLIDGIEVNDPAGGGVFNLGYLPASAVERVEVLRGAQSALYGANALTGVISLSTRRPVDKGSKGELGLSYGSHNTFSGYALTSDNHEAFNYTVIGNYFHTDGFSAQPAEFGEEWADDDAYFVRFVHGRFGLAVTEQLEFSLVANFRKSRSEFDPGLPSPWSTPIFDNYGAEQQWMGRFGMDLIVNPDWKLSASASYNTVEGLYQDAWGIRETEADSHKFDLLSHYQVLPEYSFVLGAERRVASDRLGKHEFRTHSVFSEHIWHPLDSVAVTLGGRWDDNDTYGSEFSWRTSASIELGAGWRAIASYGTGFDAPEISQLFGPWGDPDLKPETGENFDLGVEWMSDDARYTLGVTFFYLDVSDKIEYLRSSFAYANVDWVSRGVELEASAKVIEGTVVRVIYSYADAERKRAGDALILHSPESMWSVIVDQFALQDRLKLRCTARYVSGRESWDGPSDSFVRVDLSGSFRIMDHLDVWARIDNVFDKRYEEIMGYNGTPFGVFGGISLSY